MSHELRTPLNTVIGFSEMLANAEQLRIDAEHRQEYVRLINESGCHLFEVMNDILDALERHRDHHFRRVASRRVRH